MLQGSEGGKKIVLAVQPRSKRLSSWSSWCFKT